MAEARTSPRRTRARQRAIQALDLRAGGATYSQIGERLGCNPGTAYKMIMRELDRSASEPSGRVRAFELIRLDRLLLALWPAALRANTAAIDRILKIMERRARLLGLDAPAQLQIDYRREVEDALEESDLPVSDEDRAALIQEAERILREADGTG